VIRNAGGRVHRSRNRPWPCLLHVFSDVAVPFDSARYQAAPKLAESRTKRHAPALSGNGRTQNSRLLIRGYSSPGYSVSANLHLAAATESARRGPGSTASSCASGVVRAGASGSVHRLLRPDPVRYLSVTTVVQRRLLTDDDTR
jgi:hypothetical protein